MNVIPIVIIGSIVFLALAVAFAAANPIPHDDPIEQLRMGARTFRVTETVRQEVAKVEETVKENDDPIHILFEIANAELRQSMIAKYGGFEALLSKVQHDILHTDDYGTLFRVWVPKMSRFYHYVKVVNGTAEPDGSFRTYYLEVPPDMDTAKEAVAWTYGLHPDQYDVAVRT